MAAIGSLVFCTDCGNLLDGSTGNRKVLLTCDVCGARNRDTAVTTITSKSKPTAFPSALRAKRSTVKTVTEEDVQQESVIRMTCIECGRKEMKYTTKQIRSADEGTTVFYTCECGYKFNTNN